MANNSESIKQMVEQLYSNRDQTGDATFLVESERIRAHRNMLAALSPKYMAQFYGPNPDEGEIRIPNISAAAFKTFLQFFYKESIDLTMENIETVLDLAQQSLVDGFVEICVDFLKKSITTSNVCFVYRLAILYDIEALHLNCEQQISSKTMDVFASKEFLQCTRDTISSIIKLDTLNCPETVVFNACIAWARADCKQKGLDEKKAENLRAALGDVIYQVRFASINAQELATVLHDLLYGFFMPDDLNELFFITSRVKNFKSQKFNQTLRIHSKDDLETIAGSQVWSLECDRLLERVVKDRADTNISCVSTIHCKKPIRLHGFAFGIHFDEFLLNWLKTNGISVSVAQDNVSLHEMKLKCKAYHENNETTIMFEKPIERMTNFKLSFASLKVNCKLVLKDRVFVNNNKFTCSGDLLTRFFFDNL